MSDPSDDEDGSKPIWWENQSLPSEIRTDGGAEIDQFFDALGTTRRRLTLLYLNHQDCANLEELAEVIADYEGGDSTENEIKRICIDLRHYQLPNLKDHGLISYDTLTDTAALKPLPQAVEKILDLTQKLEKLDTQ